MVQVLIKQRLYIENNQNITRYSLLFIHITNKTFITDLVGQS